VDSPLELEIQHRRFFRRYPRGRLRRLELQRREGGEVYRACTAHTFDAVGKAVSGPAGSRVDTDCQDARMNCFVACCSTPDSPHKTKRQGSPGSTGTVIDDRVLLLACCKIIYKYPIPWWVHYERRYSTCISRTTTRSKHRATKPRAVRQAGRLTNQNIGYYLHLPRLLLRHHLRLPLHRHRQSCLDPGLSSYR